MREYIRPEDENRMPNLSQLSDEKLQTLYQEVEELDKLSYYPSNYLGADGYLREQVNRAQDDTKKAEAQAKLDRYRALLNKYPWYTHRDTPENIRVMSRMSDAMSGAFGSGATNNPQVEADYNVGKAMGKKYSSDLIHEEMMRRRAQSYQGENKSENDVSRAINQVVEDTADYRKGLGDRFAENENTLQQVVEAIDSYTQSLREGIAVNEQLPISNCLREIKNRLRKLKTLDESKASEKETALKTEFPAYFS